MNCASISALSSNDVVALSTSERDVLASFYNATDGDNWANSDFGYPTSRTAAGPAWVAMVRVGHQPLPRLQSPSRSIPAELATGELAISESESQSAIGPNPQRVSDLRLLSALELSENELSGSIPTSLGDLNNLTSLLA